MDDFLLSITLGEFIAAANARSFAAFFADKGLGEYAASYEAIAADETRHFQALRAVVRKLASVPDKIKKIYRGDLLAVSPDQSLLSIYERMVVMHTVFEGAAFAYMSLLAKHTFTEPRLESIKYIARIVMEDEARHMAEGFQALDYMRDRVISDRDFNEARERVNVNATALRELPSLTIHGEPDFTEKLFRLYDENVQRNVKRVFK